MIIDFRRNATTPPSVCIKGSEIERVDTYVYLGVILNNSLTWGDHVDMLIKKLNSRLYCLRKMCNINVRSEILLTFFNSTLCSVWRYCFVCWGGNVCAIEASRINRIIRKASRMIGEPQPNCEIIYQSLLQAKTDSITDGDTHP